MNPSKATKNQDRRLPIGKKLDDFEQAFKQEQRTVFFVPHLDILNISTKIRT